MTICQYNTNMAAKNGLLNINVLKSRIKTLVPQNITFQLPEKYKGTVIETWMLYWKQLLRDYKEVGTDIIKDAKEKPLKATIIASGLGFLGYCGKTNPDDNSFRDRLLTFSNEVMLVGPAVRNPVSTEHLAYMEKCHNAGLIRRLSLGFASLLWIDNYDKGVGLYAAQCSYLQPKYLTFYERVVDIGFLSKWWVLESKMNDFDVNYAEFTE